MFDYIKIQRYDKFFTILSACEHFGFTKDEYLTLNQEQCAASEEGSSHI